MYSRLTPLVDILYVCADEGGLRAMWDNVLSWMKKAVEYVALDGPAEAQATTAPTPSRVCFVL